MSEFHIRQDLPRHMQVEFGDGTHLQISTWDGAIKLNDSTAISGSYSWCNAFIRWVCQQPDYWKMLQSGGDHDD